jgi:2-hydroxychromene-2-carboxylate isomerase
VDEDISQDAVLAGICNRIEVDSRYLLDGIGEQRIKDKLRANTEELSRGLRLPHRVCRHRHVSGNDRLMLVRDAVQRLRESAI